MSKTTLFMDYLFLVARFWRSIVEIRSSPRTDIHIGILIALGMLIYKWSTVAFRLGLMLWPEIHYELPKIHLPYILTRVNGPES